MRDLILVKWLLAAAVILGLSAAAPRDVRGESNCTCRYAGQSYALETCVCIVTSSGARLACCDKVLNNTSWTFSSENCPLAVAPDHIPTQQVAGQRRQAVQERWWQAGRGFAAAMTK